jgi:hypothetical protein
MVMKVRSSLYWRIVLWLDLDGEPLTGADSVAQIGTIDIVPGLVDC